MTSQPTTNISFAQTIFIMRTIDNNWYPIPSSGKKPLEEEARDHGELNSHIKSVEDIDGHIFWSRQ